MMKIFFMRFTYNIQKYYYVGNLLTACIFIPIQYNVIFLFFLVSYIYKTINNSKGIL
jgi:hypothetical protein